MTEPDSTTAIPQITLRPAELDETEVLLIRHGRSADVVPGTPESADPPLHVEGVAQAARLADRLRAKHIAAVYSSHLARAVQTATPLAEHRGLPIGIHPELEEVRLGEWGHGEFRRRAAARDPEWVEWSRTGRWDGIPGGEGDDAFRQRVSDTVTRLAAAHRGSTIAVVCHGGTINAVVAHALGIHRTMAFSIENTSITTMRVGLHGPTIVTANDCHHLYDPVIGAS